jgi:hypothetical protein
MKFGVHTGPQNCTYDDLRRAWRMADSSSSGPSCAEWIVVALRAPFDWDSYELFTDRVLPTFR